MKTATVEASLTRPTDDPSPIQYTAGDVVGTAAGDLFTFADLPPFTGKGALLESAVCISSANQAAKPNFELYLFDAAPASASSIFEDNAAFDPNDASLLNLIAILSFAQASWKVGTATAGAGGNSTCVTANLGISFRADALYGVMVERSTYTPVNAEVFTVRLGIIR